MTGHHTDGSTAFDRAAQPVLDWIDRFHLQRRADVPGIIAQTRKLLDDFEATLMRAQVAPQSIKPARFALAAQADARARAARGIELAQWSILARQHLFEGHDITRARIREFHDTARKNGAPYKELAAFLGRMLKRSERAPMQVTHGWGWKIASFIVLMTFALAGYAGFLEYRFQAALRASFDAETLEIGLDRPRNGADLVRRLDALQGATQRVAQAALRAPFKRALRLPIFDSETHARATYQNAVTAQTPAAIAGAIEKTLATEGDGLKLYDALRAWSILSGEDSWQTPWLDGWLRDHAGPLGLGGLARHVNQLNGPVRGLVAQDTVLMDQARVFAAETSELDRAWLELKRAPETAALAQWSPQRAVQGVARVLVRRSGADITTPLDGLFTAAGWDHARDFGIGMAVQKARAIAPVITGTPLPENNRSPDMLADRLLDETISHWQNWLADLRVRPFAKRDTAILVSGILSRRENPISHLLREVWTQAGGEDRRRSHPQQLRLATAFGPAIQYLDQNRMDEIARLFSALNVALGAMDVNKQRGSERLMSVQDRARSISALRSAPRIIAQIAEDVLAQSGASDAAGQNDALTRVWQREVFPLCRDAVMGRYPFGSGVDAQHGDVAALLGPQGALPRFLQTRAMPFLETGQSPWHWKPEARFSGLSAESAVFLERASAISKALFDATGEMRQTLQLSALADRGQTLFAIGGQAVSVRARGGGVETLVWPGPEPLSGVEVSFREAQDAARLQQPGLWGLLRLIDGLRLRLRDDGARALLDLRTESGRVFLNMAFETPLNPVSARKILDRFSCPPSL